jgi:Fn3 associated
MSRILHGTLTAGIVTTVTIDAYTSVITVVNRTPSTEIYFTADGSTPTAGGADCFVALGSKIINAPLFGAATTIKLISTTAAAWSVVGEASS